MKALLYSPKASYMRELQEYCTEFHLEMDVCADRNSARELFEFETYSILILVDANSDPGVLAFAHWVRQSPKQGSIPILYVNESEDWELLLQLAQVNIPDVFTWSERNKLRSILEAHARHQAMLLGLSGNVLCIENTDSGRTSLHAHAARLGFETLCEPLLAEALKRLDDTSFSLILINEAHVGTEQEITHFLRQIRTESSSHQHPPVLILCSNRNPEERAGWLRMGGVDTLAEPLDSTELTARMAVHLRLQGLLRQVEAQREELRRVAMTDSLTGLWNRHSLAERFGQTLRRCRENQTPLSLVVADLDHFKVVNDRYGHETGDAVLQSAARLFQGFGPPGRNVFRLGGEEFLLLWPGVDELLAEELAETLRLSLEILRPNQLQITASFGVVTTQLQDTRDYEQLFKQADAAAYQAKHEGRNRVCIAPNLSNTPNTQQT